MPVSLPVLVLATLVWFASSFASAAEDRVARAPDPTDAAARGQVFQWHTADELAYEYYVPASYDHAQGANVTVLFHASNQDRRWAFAHHVPGEFRANDILVSPDGTTPNGAGAFNFRFADKDTRRIEALLGELRKVLKVNRTFLYGYGQGAHFAFAYAGEHPDTIKGVLAQAGGVSLGTKAGPKHHHQAIAILHGMNDAVVPVSTSAGAWKFFKQQHYPLVRFRTLRDGDHEPAPQQAEQLLSWCDAMTNDDFRDVAAAFDRLLAVESEPDHVARYQVAERILGWGGGAAEVREKAEQVKAAIEELAERHIEAIEKSRGRSRGDKLEKKAWIGHFRLFTQEYAGIPACDAFTAEWERTLKEHREKGKEAIEVYNRNRQTAPAEAFVAGVDAIARGFLAQEYANGDLVRQLESWKEDARDLDISRTDQRYFQKVVPLFEVALADGAEAFDAVR